MPKPATEPASLPPGFWSQLRSGFSFARCDSSVAVSYWANRYTAHPGVFEQRMRSVLPTLQYVAKIIQDSGLPSEFALLPWIESDFRALPGHRRGAAGIWQIMPATGRELGLRIDHRYDGRLDLHDSSLAVVRLLQRYWQTFADWRLADMAFNTGMYRIKHLLKLRSMPLDDRAVPDLDVSEITMAHLAKLNALACIVRSPQSHGITLPEADAQRQLRRIPLAKVLDIPVAARLAGMQQKRLRQYNAAYREHDLPARNLIMPARNAVQFSSNYARLASLNWQQWQYVRLRSNTSLLELAGGNPRHADTLALVNNSSPSKRVQADTTLWLPINIAAALPANTVVAVDSAAVRYRIRSGDTLWALARQFHLRVADLRLWNRLHSDVLHLGQVLQLIPDNQ